MSGLESVAALSLACNILQVIGVGRETVRVALQVYRDGELDPALTGNADILDSLSTDILALTLPAALSTAKTATRQEKQLVELANKCQGAARDLCEEVNFLNGSASKARSVAVLKIAIKRIWRKSRLEKLDQKLKEVEMLLQTGLLAAVYPVCQQFASETSQISRDGLPSLDAKVQSFIVEYRQGTIQLIDLVRKHIAREIKNDHQAIRSHVTHTAAQAENSINHHIELARKDEEQRHQSAKVDAHRERLLRSLRFDRMKERRNQISDSHSNTFEWMLHDGADEASGDSATPLDIQSWDSFSDWLRSTETVYWISGKPGSEKSTLIKHLLNQTQLRKYLDVWNTDSVIISHFFWRPGTVMQQSIKGLFLSLLHLLLSEDVTFYDQVIEKEDRLMLSKETETDWSPNELKKFLIKVIKCHPRPLVFFLDGIDEVLPKDGALQLLQIIDEIRNSRIGIGNLKICLGSRPEPVFLKRLRGYPQLRLETLNRQDLLQYGKDKLAIPSDYKIILDSGFGFSHNYIWFTSDNPPSREDLSDWLLELLLEKTEGVFLWLCLTVQAINKALYEEATVRDLKHQIDCLPEDLTLLFSDIWDRLSNDSPNLKQRGATYLQIMLASGWTSLPMNTFTMMAATTAGITEKIHENHTSRQISAGFLMELCDNTRRDVEARCAGLLVPPALSSASSEESRLVAWYGHEYDRLLPHVAESLTYSFLHRTVRDFLLDTEAGQKILSSGSFVGIAARVKFIEAHMAGLRLFRRPGAQILRGATGIDIYQPYLDGPLGEYIKLLSRGNPMVGLAEESNKPYDDAELFRLLLLCENAFNSGCLPSSPLSPPASMQFRQDSRRPGYYISYEATAKGEHDFLHSITLFWEQSDSAALWEPLLKMILSRNLGCYNLSRLLLRVCISHDQMNLFENEKVLSLMRISLSLGASPRDKIHFIDPFFTGHYFLFINCFRTPFQQLISQIWSLASSLRLSKRRARIFADSIELLLAHGANLQEEVHILIEVCARSIQFVQTARLSEQLLIGTGMEARGINITMAYPAQVIINIMFHRWHFRKLRLLEQEWENAKTSTDTDQGHPIAVGSLSWDAWQDTTELYPLQRGNDLENDLLIIAGLAIDSMRESEGIASSDDSHESGSEERLPFYINIPEENQRRIYNGIQRLRRGTVPQSERIKQVRERLGIISPIEEPEWQNADPDASEMIPLPESSDEEDSECE